MEEKILQFQKLANDEAVAAKLTSADSMDAMLKVMSDNGLVLTADELGAIVKPVAEATQDGAELDEEQLENVSGGGWFWTGVKVCWYVYKIWKAFH